MTTQLSAESAAAAAAAGDADGLACARLAAAAPSDAERAALLRTVALQAELLDSIHDAVAVTNLRGKVLYWNAGAARLSGWSRTDAMGRELAGLLFAQPQSFEALLDRLGRDGSAAEELPVRHKSGREAWASVGWKLLRDPLGQPTGVLAACTDITQRRRAEGDLARSQALLDAVQSIARLASVEVDHATRQLRSTHGIVRLLGLPRTPQRVDELVTSMRSASRRAFLQALDRDDATARPELELELDDGEGTRWIRVTFGAPVADDGGAQISTIAFQDITAARSARDDVLRLNASLERRVRRRTRQLEAANHELEAFSYSVSHDLKAPLTAIDGFAHALAEDLKGAASPRAGGYLDRIRAGVASMYTLIDVMLSLHRLSQAPLVRRPVDLSAIARSVVAELREREPDRPCAITIEPAIAVHGDHDLLVIAMRNLIGNAWKFSSRQPQTRIGVALEETTPALAVVRVTDQGAGFDPRQAHKLFAPFQRLHHASEFPGTGVGLATVQRIVQRHGGSIRADSAPGAGATFWISLPRGFSDTLDSTPGV